MIYDCLPIVAVLLSEILKTFLPTGRLIMGRGAPAQSKQSAESLFFECSI
jgi:hypothetical protein